jgi:hypothetical protein
VLAAFLLAEAAMRRELALIAPCLLGGCFMARQDARIRPGGQTGVTSVVMYTPGAVTHNSDSSLTGVPDRNDAANVRGITELHVAYGWKRAEFRWHIPTVRWNSSKDYLGDWEEKIDVLNPLSGAIELYVQLVNRSPVTAGIGVESARGGYAVITGELGPTDAVSLTTRAFYARSESDGRRSVLLQAQVSVTHVLDLDHDLRFFVSVITFAGDAEPTAVRAYDNDYFEYSQGPYVVANRIGLVGASIDWH